MAVCAPAAACCGLEASRCAGAVAEPDLAVCAPGPVCVPGIACCELDSRGVPLDWLGAIGEDVADDPLASVVSACGDPDCAFGCSGAPG